MEAAKVRYGAEVWSSMTPKEKRAAVLETSMSDVKSDEEPLMIEGPAFSQLDFHPQGT